MFISIVVPVYNVADYLHYAIESLIKQTYQNFEIILVNDGSTDNSPILCEDYAKQYENIYVFHKENGGLSDARNYGVERASGEYIGFVDSDDYIHESMYEKLYEAIKKSGTEISECGVTRVYKNMLRPHYEGEDYFLILDKQEYLEEYLENRRLYGSAWCKLIQRDLAKKIKFPTGKIYEDAFYTLELLGNVNKFTIISGNYYYYYIRENSITTRPFSSKDMDYVEIMDRIRDYTLSNFPKYKDQLLVRLTYAYLSIFNQLIELDNYKTKKEYKVLKNKLKDSYFKVLANKKAPKNLKLALVLLSINERLYKFILSKYKKYESNE